MKLLKVLSWVSIACAMGSVLWVAQKLDQQPPRISAPVNAVGGR